MPPHEIPTTTLLTLEMKRRLPTQSIRSTASQNEISGFDDLMQSGTDARTIPQAGRLIQKIHRNEAQSAKALPTTGPTTLPTTHAAGTKENQLDRCRQGTRVGNIIWTRVSIPPAPIPCENRPTRREVKLLARPHITDPTANIRTDSARRAEDPKSSANIAITGCETADDNRYEVPDQNESIVEP
jgi:hypothetical protein